MKSVKTRIYAVIPAVLACMFLFAGCGQNESLEQYADVMDQYYSDLAQINYRINALDENSEDSQEELLALLDEMDSLTTQMAQTQVPEQFKTCETLADEAADNMSEAVELYHQLYSSDEYNESVADGAYEYYKRANKRIVYIKSILHGEVPEDLTDGDASDDAYEE